MLIQLTVENFRSIRDEQTIDFYAPMERDETPENTFVVGDPKIRVLRSIGFYGANASGKSTIFEALYTLQKVINGEGCSPDGGIPFYNPYRLDKTYQKKPTKFGLEFAFPVEGIASYRHFLYEVSFDKDRVCHETLKAFGKGGREICLFERTQKDTYRTIKIGKALSGERRRVPFFPNQSFLAAARKSADSPKLLRDIASYLCGGLKLPRAVGYGNMAYEKIATSLLPYADVGISSALKRKRNPDPKKIAMLQKVLPEKEFEIMIERMVKEGDDEYCFIHKGEAANIGEIKLDEESEGTQSMFRELPDVLDALDNGLTLLRDEIDTHMHPYIVELMIRLFNDPEINANNAQLLFSTHDIGLLSERFMRKDQIWFAEKHCGASEYFSLQDFDDNKVPAASPFSKWYMEGRFGGVPSIDYEKFSSAIKLLSKEGLDHA